MNYGARLRFHPLPKEEGSSRCASALPEIKLSEIRPVPSQDKLQTKILDYWKNNAWIGYTHFQLFSEFKIFVFEKCNVRELIEKNVTITEMLLMFLMQEIYNKKWDGENWI